MVGTLRFAHPTIRRDSALPRHEMPGLCIIIVPRKQRAQGKPDARSHPQSRVPVESAKRTRVIQVRRNSRPSLRNGLRLMARSPRCPGLIATVVRRLSAANLIPASGDRDHTLSPSASARFVCRATRPSHPAPNVRDDRETPLVWEQDAGKMCMFSDFRK